MHVAVLILHSKISPPLFPSFPPPLVPLSADIYGPSEGILGQFVARRKAEGKPVQAFTKFVPNVFQTKATPAVVEASIRRSLRALRTDSLDLVQMHW